MLSCRHTVHGLAFLMVFLLLSANFLISSDRGCPESICFFLICFDLYPELVELYVLQEEEHIEAPSYIHIESNDFSYRR